MQKDDLRRANLRRVIEMRFNGVDAYLADAIAMPRPNLSEIMARKRPFTEKKARHIETVLGLPASSLDAPPDQQDTLSAEDQALLSALRTILLKRHLPPHIRAAILTLAESSPERSR